jgi:hypothetical protein
MGKRATLFAAMVILLNFAVYGDLIAGAKVFPLSELKSGQEFYGFSTLGPGGQTRFTGKVLGIFRDTLGPGHNWIVVSIDGADFKETAIISGQSGSPVYAEVAGEERFIGTVSYADTFSKNAIAYLTPAEELLAVKDYGGKRSGLKPVMTTSPLEVRDEIMEFLAENGFGGLAQGMKRGYVSVNTSCVASGTEAEPAKIRPGDVLSIELAYGDFNFGSFGTVSYVDEATKQIFLLGHPMEQSGPVEYRLMPAEVLGVQANYRNSYIIAAPRVGAKPVGIITQDRETAIMGILGEEPKHFIPFKLKLTNSAGASREINFHVTGDPVIGPIIGSVGVMSSISSWSRSSGSKTVFLKGELITDVGAVAMSDEFHGKESIDRGIGRHILERLRAIMANDYGKVAVKGVSLEVSIFDEIRSLKIEDVSLADGAMLAPGSEASLKITFSRPSKEPKVLDLKIRVPADLNFGTAKVMVGSAERIDEIEKSSAQVVNLRTLLENMNQKRKPNLIYVYIIYPPAKPTDISAEAKGGEKGIKKTSKRLSSSVEEFEISPTKAGLAAEDDQGDFIIEGEGSLEFRVGDKASSRH